MEETWWEKSKFQGGTLSQNVVPGLCTIQKGKVQKPRLGIFRKELFLKEI